MHIERIVFRDGKGNLHAIPVSLRDSEDNIEPPTCRVEIKAYDDKKSVSSIVNKLREEEKINGKDNISSKI